MSKLGKKYSFNKEERLKSRKDIEALFAKPQSLFAFPLKVVYAASDTEVHQIAISIPKRQFKKAVDRNRLKRQVLEAYRLHKHIIYSETNTNRFQLMFIYVDKKAMDYDKIEASVIKLVQQLSKI